jgi:hypothetical protein
MDDTADDFLAPIAIDGHVRRSFIFPAGIDVAFRFYRDLPRDFSFLRHIYVVRDNKSGCYRLKYETVEMGLYRVQIFCDVMAQFDQNPLTITFVSCPNEEPIPQKAGLHSLIAMGAYQSRSLFEDFNGQTLIHFELSLHANLSVPIGLAMIPAPVRKRVAQGISRYRIREIADSFISRSIKTYQSA